MKIIILTKSETYNLFTGKPSVRPKKFKELYQQVKTFYKCYKKQYYLENYNINLNQIVICNCELDDCLFEQPTYKQYKIQLPLKEIKCIFSFLNFYLFKMSKYKIHHNWKMYLSK
jgi:hypothetical protein